MTLTLTEDQRWLLVAVGGWMMADCFIAPERGIDRLMASRYGSSNGRRNDKYPDWLKDGFDCGYGKIVSPMFSSDEPHAVVTKAQLTSFAHSLDAGLVEQLRDARSAMTAETVRWSRTCHCGATGGDAHKSWGPSYEDLWHPSREQDDEHRKLNREQASLVQHLVLQACGFGEPVGQLDLFDALAEQAAS